MRRPDFIIAGAPRSGTTWLYHAADRHPHIAMAKPVTPEPKFFLVDELYEKGLQHYSATWFEPLPVGCVTGEKSTNYLESTTACNRIARDLPTVKLVFVLRDPTERAYSNYLWTKKNGLERESFARAIALEPERERSLDTKLRFARPFSYFARGLYAQMLTPWLEQFPRNRILILRSEDIVSDPGSCAARLHMFLEVEPVPDVARELGRINSARIDSAIPPDDQRVFGELRERYHEANRQLSLLLGEDLGWR